DSNYFFVSVSAEILLELTIQEGFQVTESLRRVFARLANTQVESLMPVAEKYLLSIWGGGYPATLIQARALTYTFLTESGIALLANSKSHCERLAGLLR